MIDLGRRPLLIGLSITMLFVGGCGGGGGGGANSSDNPDLTPLIVQQVLPTNGQEVLPDLSDVDGIISLRFSNQVMRSSALDPNNAFNGLTSDVNILDSAFARVPGTPCLQFADRDTDCRKGNILTFKPAGGVLANGQYTVTVSRDVQTPIGGRLNQGSFDFRSSFSVGTDVFSPVIRNTFPANNQKDVPKNSQVIITFNESLNPATITNATVTVVDGGANPPVAVAGSLKTSRDDFEIVFTPDPANPMPPNATIVVTLTGGAGGITDVVGNPFEGDPATPGTYQFQFETVKEPPPPNNPIPVDLANGDALIVFATQDSIGTLQEGSFIAGGGTDFSTWGTGNVIPNSLRKIGQPGETLLDRRFSPIDGHSWIYVIDRASRSVTIVGTRDNKVVHRWRTLPDPRGLAQRTSLTLFVTNYANDSVSFIDIGQTIVGTPQASAVVKGLADIQNRVDVPVGRGPLGAAHSPDAPHLYVANSLDNTCTRINTATGQVMSSFQTGTSPQDIGATFFIPINIGWFQFVTCLGGGTDETGSVTLGWHGGVGPNDQQNNLFGFKNPKGVIYDRAISCWVTNSGGNTASQVSLSIAGGAFAATILPIIGNTTTVGKNPTSCTIEPFWPANGFAPRAVITADRGSSQLTFIDYAAPIRPTFSIKVPGVQEVSAYFDQ